MVFHSLLVCGDNLHYEKFTDGSVKCIEDEIPFELPDGWAWSKVGPLCEYITSGSRGWAQYYSDTGSLFLRMGNLSRDSFELRMDNLQRVDLPDNAEGVRTRVTENDLLFSITAEIGMLGLIPADFEEAYINQHVGLIRFLKEAQAKYFPYILMSDFCRNQYYTTQSGMKNSFRLDNIQNILTPVPPLAEQIRIAEKLSCIWAQIQQIDSESATARDIIILAKAKILDLAIRGQLVPQDPVDEPASVLLERIRAEKEELIRQGKIKRDKKESVIFRGEDNSYYEKIGGKVENISDEIPFELPEGWAWCRGYSCFEGMESTKPQGDFFDYIDIDAIDNRLHCIKKTKNLPVSDAPSRASRAVKDGSVLFSLVRPYLENIALVEEKHSNCIASTGFYVCNSNGVLLPEFMFFLMISGYVVNGLNQYMKGDNSPSISKDNIENWLYPAPPIGEQQTICAKLKTVFTLVENVEKSLN
jgi:type I restriction enzyme S subunit